MSTLLKPIPVREKLLNQGVKVFTPQVFRRIFGSSPTSTKYFLETQTASGFLTRLKNGVYFLKTDPPSEEEMANALYQPSYISFEYALAYHNLLPEMPYGVTSATTKPTRLFTTDTTSFSYRTIKKLAYTGYTLVKKEDRSFLIAEPEKAYADYLYFVALKKMPLNDRLVKAAKGRIGDTKLEKYTSLYQSKPLTTLLEKVK